MQGLFRSVCTLVFLFLSFFGSLDDSIKQEYQYFVQVPCSFTVYNKIVYVKIYCHMVLKDCMLNYSITFQCLKHVPQKNHSVLIVCL
jgi:hypothetical protein